MTTREDRIMRKLLELAKRGETGERDNAGKLLNRMCAKHGITREDLDRGDIRPRLVEFHVASENEHALAVQVATAVTGEAVYLGYPEGNPTLRLIQLPGAQAVEFETLYTAYLSAWRENVAALLYAFVARNNIFHPQDEGTPLEAATPEELARWRKAARMLPAVDRVHVHRQLGGGPGKSEKTP